MPGVKLNNYSIGDPQPDNIMITLDAIRRGENRASLTEYTTAMRPAIAKGSIVDIAGELIEFQADEAISGTPAAGDVYIAIDPISKGAYFTNSAPVWRNDYQGWYNAVDGTHKYLNYVIDYNGSLWVKAELAFVNNKVFRVYPDGKVTFDRLVLNQLDVNGDANVSGVLSAGDLAAGITVNGDPVSGQTWANNRFHPIHTHPYAPAEHNHQDDDLRPEEIYAKTIFASKYLNGSKRCDFINVTASTTKSETWSQIAHTCPVENYRFIATGYIESGGDYRFIYSIIKPSWDVVHIYARSSLLVLAEGDQSQLGWNLVLCV